MVWGGGHTRCCGWAAASVEPAGTVAAAPAKPSARTTANVAIFGVVRAGALLKKNILRLGDIEIAKVLLAKRDRLPPYSVPGAIYLLEE